MSNRAQRKIARMVARGGLEQAEARAALRLLAVAESAAQPPDAGHSALGGPDSWVGAGGWRSRNRCEQRLVGRIADRHLFRRWQQEMRGRGRDPDVTIGVLLLEHSMSALDRRMKRRKGWARREVREGIGIFRQLMANPGEDCELDKAGQRRYQIG